MVMKITSKIFMIFIGLTLLLLFLNFIGLPPFITNIFMVLQTVMFFILSPIFIVIAIIVFVVIIMIIK